MLTTRELSSSGGVDVASGGDDVAFGGDDVALGGDDFFGEGDRGIAVGGGNSFDEDDRGVAVGGDDSCGENDRVVALGGDDSFGKDGRGLVGESSPLLALGLEPFPSPTTATRSWTFGSEECVGPLACLTGFDGGDDDDDDLRRLDLWAGVPLGFAPSDDRPGANRKDTCFFLFAGDGL